jgi:histidinol dehydrogenase
LFNDKKHGVLGVLAVDTVYSMTINLRVLKTADPAFKAGFERLLDRAQSLDPAIEETVRDIVADVRARGDAALLDYTRRFDRRNVGAAAELEIPRARLREVARALPREQYEALANAAERVRAYHERQRVESWSYTEPDGTVLGQQVTPLERVGLYVPGGKAAYPSSVIMNAIPAKVADVHELIMTVPAPEGALNDMVLAAAYLGGVDRVFTAGGAQAVAALAYGTATIPKVDKIVGPGNIYVATAKRLVFGAVDIDMIAGPSEIVVLCDGKTDPEWVAMDLFSQAEHDQDAQAILISLDEAFTQRVRAAIEKLLPGMERRDIIRASLENRGALITAGGLDEAIALVNRIAPEHLELSVEDAAAAAGRVRHAGAIFLGRYTAEALGDYCAGPNHVLPTSGTARFSSPLGVYDFQKRTSLIQCSADGASRLGETASVLARGEGLTAHARSAEYRIKK